MKLCGQCKNREKKRRCEYYTAISNYAEKCKDFEEKKQTNADRIREMSDEELAEFLPIVLDFMCKQADKCMENIFNRGECEKTKECALKWLQSEVEE